MSKTVGVINNSFNRKSIEKLEENGFEVILIPNYRTEKIENNSKFQQVVNDLLNYDWLIFTDIFSVDYFVEYLIERNFDLFELDNLRICAYGEAVADRLRFSQIHADIIPRKLSDEIILEDLKNYIASDNEIKCLTFLIIKEESSEILIKKELEKVSKSVTEISVYSAKTNEIVEIPKLKILINGGAFDEIMLFLAEDLQMFRKMFGLNGLNDLSQNVKLTTKNETVQKSIEELKY